jgi:integrase/recombinase XerD
MVIKHLEWMQSRSYSESSVIYRAYELGEFISWLDIRGITQPKEVTKAILERYRRHLYILRKKDGQPLSARTQTLRLITIRVFFKWLARSNYILSNPASELELPKIGHPLPPYVLTLKEAEIIMNQVNLNAPMGLRDRAILETFYSTGIRRFELINLKLHHLDVEGGTLTIRQGKGKRDRMVPIGERAISWIEKYLNELRPVLLKDVENDDGILFITSQGKPFRRKYLTNVVSDYVRKAKIGKSGSCHLFRHTMATLMLEGGADIRYIQEMLGHLNLETTQIYTRVSISKLKEVHKRTHPGAKLKRKRS